VPASEAGIEPVSAIPADMVSAVSAAESAQPSPRNAWPANVTLFAMADGAVFPATQYWRDQEQLWYVSEGETSAVSLRSIDWSTTAKLNIARKVRVTLRNAPTQN
jgi:hypothetical protein